MGAPTVFVSYSKESPGSVDWVLKLANRLRREGVDAIIDQFVPFPPEGWLLWMERQVQGSDFVLVVCTREYFARSQVGGPAGRGLGATHESQLIRTVLYDSRGINRKYIPVLIQKADAEFVPPFLRPYTTFAPDDQSDFESLVSLVLGDTTGFPERAELQRDPTFLRPWGVPFPRNPNFTGRDDTLVSLTELLATNRRTPIVGGCPRNG